MKFRKQEQGPIKPDLVSPQKQSFELTKSFLSDLIGNLIAQNQDSVFFLKDQLEQILRTKFPNWSETLDIHALIYPQLHKYYYQQPSTVIATDDFSLKFIEHPQHWEIWINQTIKSDQPAKNR